MKVSATHASALKLADYSDPFRMSELPLRLSFHGAALAVVLVHLLGMIQSPLFALVTMLLAIRGAIFKNMFHIGFIPSLKRGFVPIDVFGYPFLNVHLLPLGVERVGILSPSANLFGVTLPVFLVSSFDFIGVRGYVFLLYISSALRVLRVMLSGISGLAFLAFKCAPSAHLAKHSKRLGRAALIAWVFFGKHLSVYRLKCPQTIGIGVL